MPIESRSGAMDMMLTFPICKPWETLFSGREVTSGGIPRAETGLPSGSTLNHYR
jgi:hypothetical protein